MLKNTPAMYKKEYPFLKEVDSLALANVQLHLEKAYKNFFRDPKVGFPRFKSKHHSKNSYTTNVVNGNILVEGNRIRLPKVKADIRNPLRYLQDHKGSSRKRVPPYDMS